MGLEITKLLDGERNAVFHVSITGDTGGELRDEVVIDPAHDFDPALPAKPILSVVELWYDLSGFSAKLEYDYLASDTPLWSMSDGRGAHMNFECFGGVPDTSYSADGHGKVKLTTQGLVPGGVGTIIIKARKR